MITTSVDDHTRRSATESNRAGIQRRHDTTHTFSVRLQHGRPHNRLTPPPVSQHPAITITTPAEDHARCLTTELSVDTIPHTLRERRFNTVEAMTSKPARQYLISTTTTIVNDHTRRFATEPDRAKTQHGPDTTVTLQDGRRRD